MTHRIFNRPVSGSPRLLTTLIFAALLGGCATQTTLEQPTPDLPQQFSVTGSQLQPQKWWNTFADPQLNRLIDQALGGNFNLKAAVARVQQAEALAIKSGASLTPSLDASLDAGKTFHSTADSENLQLGLQASYEIDLWSRLQAAETSAQLDYLASREDLEVAALTLSADVADRWYALLTQEALVKLYQDQLKTLKDQLAIIELRFQNGQQDSEDVLQQQQQIENLRANLVAAESEQQIIQQQLALLLGQSQLSGVRLSRQLPKLAPMPATGIPADLASRRPDLKQAWLTQQSQQQGLIVAEADRLPQIHLSASLLSTSADLSTLVNDWTTGLAASLVAPLFDGGQRKAEVQRQKALVDESVHHYSQAVLEAFSDIETTLTQEASEQQQLDSVQLQLALAKKAETIKWSRYRNGDSSFLEVLTAQKSRLDLEQQQIQSHGQLLANRIAVHRAIAGDLNYAQQVLPTSSMTQQKPSGSTL